MSANSQSPVVSRLFCNPNAEPYVALLLGQLLFDSEPLYELSDAANQHLAALKLRDVSAR